MKIVRKIDANPCWGKVRLEGPPKTLRPRNSTGDFFENVETSIKIYSLTGSLVKEINLGLTTKGEHKQRFDASILSIGSYFISLESGNDREVAKFIVTR